MQNLISTTSTSFLLVLLFVLNTAPALNFPLVPEIFLLGLCFILWPFEKVTQPKPYKIGMYLTLFLFGITFFRAMSAFITTESTHQLCLAMPGASQKLECIFQAGVDQNYSLRSLLYLCTALALCSIVYKRQRLKTSNKQNHVIPIAFIVSGLSLIATSFIFLHFKITPPFYLISQNFSTSRLSILVENPTWIWPLLIPTIISLMYFLSGSFNLPIKMLSTATLLIVCYFLLRTQQRGALISCFLVFMMILILGILTIFKTKRTRLIIGLLGIAGLCFGLLFFNEIYQFFGQKLAEYGIGSRFTKQKLLVSARSSIWQLAFEGIKDYLWLGHGYSSWFEEFGKLRQNTRIPALDTAHNFFIHTLFELGLIHLLAIFLTGLCFIYGLFKKSLKHNRKLIIPIVTAISLWLLALTIQEIDFVRSVYYSNAILFAWLLALPLKPSTLKITEPESKLTWVYPGLRVAGMILLLMGVFFSSKFSMGGYQYEAHYSNGYQPRVRWLRPEGTLGHYQSRLGKDHFAVYKVTAARSNSFKLYGILDNNDPIGINYREKDTMSFLPIPNQNWYDSPLTYQTNPVKLRDSRYLSVMLNWPPTISQIPLIHAKGAYEWESYPGKSGSVFWCMKNCSVELLPCRKSSEVQYIELIAARPDISQANPVKVKVASKKDQKTLSFDQPNESLLVPVEQMQRISITSDKSYETDEDPREKAILISKSVCTKETNSKVYSMGKAFQD